MLNESNGGPAFPAQHRAFVIAADVRPEQLREQLNVLTENTTVTGMTLRDYFAATALQGILAHHGDGEHLVQGVRLAITHAAYEYADAMLTRRDMRRGT